MFEDRTYNRTFYSGPQSVTSLVAAFLEPGITVLVFFLAMQASGEYMDRPALTLCLLGALSWGIGNVVSRASGVSGGLSFTDGIDPLSSLDG